MPVLSFITNNQGLFGAMMIVNSFPQERMLTLRERASGTYDASAYFLAKTSADTLATVIYPIWFSILVYLLIGLQRSGQCAHQQDCSLSPQDCLGTLLPHCSVCAAHSPCASTS